MAKYTTVRPPCGCQVHVGCQVQGVGCKVQGAGCKVLGAGCRVPGAGCRVLGYDGLLAIIWTS